MKSTVKNSNSILKTIAVATTAAVLFAGNPISSFANTISENNKTVSNGPESAVNVQYIGADEKQFEFRVEFENPTAEKFTLVVKVNGDKVFTKEYNDVHFSKKILLMKDGSEEYGVKPTFEISTGSKLIQRNFSIEKKVTESMVVTKL